MESSQRIMSLLNALREELQSTQTPSFVNLSQSFDRLVLGYQNGKYSETEVEAGIVETRTQLQASSSHALRPMNNSRRDNAMNRNYRELAERLLSQDRGSWDSRHVEIVQGAISELAKSDATSAQSVARDLQKRMSESVWFGNLELSDTIHKIETESKTIQQSLLDELKVARNAENIETLQLPETERILANEENVKKLVSEARTDVVRNRTDNTSLSNNNVGELRDARRELETLSMQKRKAEETAELQSVTENIREAALRLLSKDSEKVSSLFNAALKNASSEIDPQTALKLAQLAETANSNHSAESVQNIQNALKSIQSQSPAIHNILNELESIQVRHEMLHRIANAPSAASTQSVDEARLLDARLLFEQKRMQFEQNSNYQSAETDMLKALDFEAPERDSSTWRNVENSIQQIHQIAQSAAAGDIGLYAPVAGSEYARNVKNALHLADKSSPNPFQIPTLQSYTAKRSNRALRDVKQLAYHPSVRADMGFAAKRAEMDAASQQPLFKRARFSRDNKQVNELLPALYKVSDVKLKKDPSKPLRKSFKDLNLNAANLELVKIIENQFDPSVSGRSMDKTSGVANDPAQRIEAADNPHARVVNIISDWVDARKDLRRLSADTKELIDTGRMDSKSIESNLKGEAMQLPASVQSKLSPFLGFDLSNVKIFTGPIAAMASEAMGAHAFTLGKNIFLGENKLNFNTAEGLGLLAHELLHTSHFSSGDSVDSKEQAAEAMEARVKNAFDSGTSLRLALEGDADKKTTGKTDEHSSAVGTLPAGSVGARPTYDAEYVFEVVCDKVIQLMYESFQLQKERNGSDS